MNTTETIKDTYEITEVDPAGFETTWQIKAKTLRSAKRQASMKQVYTNTRLTIYKLYDDGETEFMAKKGPILDRLGFNNFPKWEASFY